MLVHKILTFIALSSIATPLLAAPVSFPETFSPNSHSLQRRGVPTVTVKAVTNIVQKYGKQGFITPDDHAILLKAVNHEAGGEASQTAIIFRNAHTDALGQSTLVIKQPLLTLKNAGRLVVVAGALGTSYSAYQGHEKSVAAKADAQSGQAGQSDQSAPSGQDGQPQQ